MRKLLAWLIYRFPRISSGSASFGGAAGIAEPARPFTGASAAATGRNAGAAIFFVDIAGTSGFTEGLARIAEVFSCFITAASGVFSLTGTSVAASAAEPAEESALAGAFTAGLARVGRFAVAAASFLAAASLSAFESTAPIVDGTISAILSFSTKTYPKGVRTLNMLSS